MEVAKLEAPRGGGKVDWRNYYQTNKGRLLAMGSILIVLGLYLYFARGVEATLVLPIVGIVLLIAGVIYKPRKKADEAGNSRSRLLRSAQQRALVITKNLPPIRARPPHQEAKLRLLRFSSFFHHMHDRRSIGQDFFFLLMAFS